MWFHSRNVAQGQWLILEVVKIVTGAFVYCSNERFWNVLAKKQAQLTPSYTSSHKGTFCSLSNFERYSLEFIGFRIIMHIPLRQKCAVRLEPEVCETENRADCL